MKSLYLRTEEAVGKVLCHDITKIVKDTFKGVAFKKGHVIRQEDVDDSLHDSIWGNRGAPPRMFPGLPSNVR